VSSRVSDAIRASSRRPNPNGRKVAHTFPGRARSPLASIRCKDHMQWCTSTIDDEKQHSVISLLHELHACVISCWNGAVTDGGSDDERTRYVRSSDSAAWSLGNGQLARAVHGARKRGRRRQTFSAAGSRNQLGQRSEIVIHEAKSPRACVDPTSPARECGPRTRSIRPSARVGEAPFMALAADGQLARPKRWRLLLAGSWLADNLHQTPPSFLAPYSHQPSLLRDWRYHHSIRNYLRLEPLTSTADRLPPLPAATALLF